MFTKEKKSNESLKWDKKSQNYPRYNPNSQEFQNKLWDVLEEKNIFNQNSLVLDIGCGTGVYTLPLAKKVKKVYGMDISEKMLNILLEDARTHSIDNIIAIHSNWQELDLKEKMFDVVFASKTPALREYQDYEKMMEHSKKHLVYLGWAGVKESNIKQKLRELYSLEFKKFDDTSKLKQWLKEKEISYHSILFNDILSRPLSIENGVDQIKEYLTQANEHITLSEDEILDILKSLMKNEKLIYELQVRLELILWEK